MRAFLAPVILLLLAGPVSAADDAGIDFFEKKIRPLLIERCYNCHSQAKGKAKGGLRLDTRDAVLKGGDQGPALIPGKPDASLLIKAVRFGSDDLRMPPNGKLSEQEIATLVEWVQRGAPDPRVAVAPTTTAHVNTADGAGRNFWSFVPPRSPQAPMVRNSAWPRGTIDRFILARLEAAGLPPARDAERGALLRRVTFDLTGLPPTPAEVAAALSDQSVGWYERVVDRLLASPAFGERWARHWLDLSCYADLADADGNVVIRDAWRYRDYVIDAFNHDKPFDRFVTEQIAGDLLPYRSGAARRAQVIATGFLAIGPWSLQNYIKPQMLADVVDHQIDKVGRVFLGLTLGCARCHDHKFDPVPTADYYALAGIFHSTLTTRHDGPGVWSQIMRTPLPETSEESAAREAAIKEHDQIAAGVQTERERLKRQKSTLEGVFAVLRAFRVGDHPEVGRLREKQKAVDKDLKEVETTLQRLQYNRPAPPQALAVRDVDKPGDSRIYLRGSFQSLGVSVPRGVLHLGTTGNLAPVAAADSGRRELALWLVDERNPLTARVLVNRLWHHLFGVGLVRSVDYFGIKGETPSHPELLDYLATRFVAQGWSIKTLIREIVLSRTYQMASDHSSTALEIDPGNRLLWRMNRRRHEAEALRDAVLAVSGRLDRGCGGPSLGLDLPGNVNGLGGGVNPPTYTSKTIPQHVRKRRTIYLPLLRLRPAGELEILSTFDFPHPNEITGARAVTTVPTQALFLLNAPFLKQQAQHTARRLLGEAAADEGRIARLYLLALGRTATASETRLALQFLDACARARPSPPSPAVDDRVDAWAQLCHAVFASNEFLFKE